MRWQGIVGLAILALMFILLVVVIRRKSRGK